MYTKTPHSYSFFLFKKKKSNLNISLQIQHLANCPSSKLLSLFLSRKIDALEAQTIHHTLKAEVIREMITSNSVCVCVCAVHVCEGVEQQ